MKYEQARAQEGGWEGFREFVVVKKVKEIDVLTSFFKSCGRKSNRSISTWAILNLKGKNTRRKIYTYSPLQLSTLDED
ncbi:hypothetical protein ACH33_11480 [Aneurinibacillus sp. XH2]|uniref:hypothetical protein n=1 Tax=Aneurinibacillus TaxID=55079 RepID=UPI00070C2915|nr:hypothetical protein ACH33_11480 [Aneurinibacillus sp. XH2]